MAQLDIRDGEGQERQETAEQTQATATDFQDRVEALVQHLQSWSREQGQDRSEGIG